MNRDSNSPDSFNPFTNEQSSSAPYPSFTPQPYRPLSHDGNGPASLRNEPREFIPPEHSPLSQKQNGGSLPPQLDVPPKIGLGLERDDGNLGIDFGSGVNVPSSEFGTDESGSELPWACPEPLSALSIIWF